MRKHSSKSSLHCVVSEKAHAIVKPVCKSHTKTSAFGNVADYTAVKQRGVNVVIYANQLTRSGFPAMQKTAETILQNHRAKEADDRCMSIKEIITLIPEE